MSQHQLPRLTANNKVPTVSTPGEWAWFGHQVLSSVGDSLKTDVNPQFFNVDSIPDVWARPLLFSMAFSDASHPLHRKIVGEWRGMLTLLALAEWRSDPLAVEAVSLRHGNDGQGDNGGAADRFSHVVYRTAPVATIHPKATWSDIYLFRYDGEPIAITTPLTLVSTAVRYRAHGVEWWSSNVFRDPLGTYAPPSANDDKLNPQQRDALCQWLTVLEENLTKERKRANVSAATGNAKNAWNSLLKHLQAFSKEAGRGLSSQKTYSLRENVFNMTRGSLYSHLGTLPDRPSNDASKSPVLLMKDEERAGNDVPNLLIIGDEIADQWKKRPQDVVVYGPHTLASTRNAAGKKTSFGDDILDSAEWRRGSELFCDRLAVFDETRAFNSATTIPITGSGRMEVTPVIPLARKLLDYLTPASLAERAEIRQTGNGEYRVTVRLPLQGPDGNGRDVKFEKEYTSEDVVNTVASETPLFEIWPDFVASGWSEYYTFYRGIEAFYMHPFPEPEAGDIRQEKDRRGEVQGAITRIDTYPEAALCSDFSGKGYYGFVALSAPHKAASSSSGEWTVGVDFGTTNTTVYVAGASGEAHPVVFEGRLLSAMTDRPLRKTETRNGFIPYEKQDVPFLTFFHDLPTGATETPSRDIDLPLEGHVLYVNNINTRKEITAGEIHHNLKWSNTPADRARTRAFLQQIVLQVRAEAAARRINKIRWRYSFPSSFSEDQMGSMRNMWHSLVGKDDIQKSSESLSTATYFLEAQQAPMMAGSVCIDIGGASADVAIWQKGKTLQQTSILLAGREIFIKSFASDLQRLAAEFDQKVPTEANGSESAALTTDLEEVLMLKGDDLLGSLHEVSGTAALARLRSGIGMGIAGIFYYVGLIIRQLVNDRKFNAAEGIPNVYFGGNGSKMLHWLASGRFDPSSNETPDREISDLFRQVLKEAAGLEGDDFTVSLTPISEVKHEVAYGLVIDRNLTVDDRELVIAGENFATKSEGESRTWSTVLTPEVLSEGIDVTSDLDHLRTVIRLFNDFAADSGTLFDSVPDEHRVIRAVREDVRNRLNELAGRPKEKIDVESLFILAVKSYLDRIRTS